ncbi:MAG: N-6 DNA methylase [Candidatus Thermoplasmatota archaeon]|nr:N-6 DNA methylase [Candidatus Thermoplasmatota archaeon]
MVDKDEQDYGINLETVLELVSKYEQIKNSGEIKRYNEESTKKDFILPLFEALGWNVYNRSKRNDSISAEETISKKRVDYGFRINGIPKFFLEAKSMKEDNIQTNLKYVTQAIDYAWMKSCSWAILCNFETIAVYNADWKESNYGNNLFFVLHPSDFLTDRRFTYFSKIAFENNELDKIASKYGKKQLKNPINKQLLEDMIHFREVLSKDVVRNNQDKHLSQDDIDEAVQRILDRLIFIRNAEDRGLEENQLQSIVRQWRDKGKGHLVKEISGIYKDYDNKYNSKLFAHHLCDDLYIDNEALQEVIEGLNHAKDNSYRYDFSIIESDVLGNIYEQYLGNILKSTPKRAKLEESKTHRKEQGIYYTPSYIVDYIVKNTVGEYIKTHKPEEIHKVRILDPACGSGSFLIRVYKELEDYWKKELKLDESGLMQTRFDTENFEKVYTLKTEILKNNIFGVDLDPKAVEIAQLNLLLQISERGHRLPLLQNNIKIGNSLIDDSSISDRAFKWEEEFPEIMKEGGFDIVIGNPPYFKIFEGDPINKTDDYKEIKSGMMNASAIFINRSLKLVMKEGRIGMIVPKMLSFTDSWDKIRYKILANYKFLNVIDCGRAFKDVLLEQIVFILKKDKPLDNDKIVIGELDNRLIRETANVLQSSCLKENKISLEPNPIAYEIKSKMESTNRRLGDIVDIILGLGIQGRDIFFDEPSKDSEKVLRGDDIQRYTIRGCRYYSPNNPEIQKYIRTIEQFKKPHIVAQRIVAHIRDHIKITAALDKEGLFSFNTVTNIFVKSKEFSNEFILALLNSNIVQYYTYKFIYSNAIRSMDLYKAYAKNIPIPELDNTLHQKISDLCMEIISKTMTYYQIKNRVTDEVGKLDMEIEDLQTKIDEMFYDMYHITEYERKVIEDSLK